MGDAMSKLMVKLGVMVVGLAVASFNACADSNEGGNQHNNQCNHGKSKNHSCKSDGGEGGSRVGAFDAFEAGGALNGPILTHLAGQPFQLDVVAVNAGAVDTGKNQNITVGLVDANAPGFSCATATPIAGSVQSAALDHGKRRFPFTVANAYQNLQVQVKVSSGEGSQASTVICPVAQFSVRPLSFAVSSNANADLKYGASATATPTVTVGANFALSANAFGVNAAGVPVPVTGYDGTPMIDPAKLVRSNAAAGTLTGDFAAASAGVASGTFTYSEVGYFRILAQGVYDDSFTSVDQGTTDANSDCVIGSFSNTPNDDPLGKGRVGCNFGNAAATDYFGRFVQDANAYKGSDTYIYRGRRGR
ncbi:MAG TPA: hypothetical protein VFW53_08880, partial [Gallionella sp.]|nr:hypothetical protein [Gallionella sp.]